MHLLAARQSQGDFHFPVFEVHPQRHQCHAALHRLADELPNLMGVQQQLARPKRLVVRVSAMAVRLDMDVVDEYLAVLDPRETVTQVGAALANGLHFGASKDQPGLERFENVVVVKRLPIFGNVLLRRLAFGFLKRHASPTSPQAARPGPCFPD